VNSAIRSVDAFEIILPLPEPLRLGEITVPHREYTIVKITDEDGVVGTSYGLSRNAPISLVLLKTIAPTWRNSRLEDYGSTYAQTLKANIPLGSNGIFWRALSLADCAAHDLLAQRARQPLYQYLGGKRRVVPTILVGGYPLADETSHSLAQQMQLMQTYHPYGIKIGSCSDYARDTQRLKTCREALPDGPPLMIDLYWNAQNAERLSREAVKWSEYNMGWIEDPFTFDDFGNLAALSEKLAYPVAAGDEQSGRNHFQHLMDYGRIGVVRLDATVCGGITAFLEICRLAAERNLEVACHVFHLLHSHLAAALPNIRTIEYMPPALHLDAIQLVWESELAWQDGGFAPPTRPGIGYPWDEDALAYYRRHS
jgi:L-alanine-DL-glutamate epimerase-like enolase superfamily enzyme